MKKYCICTCLLTLLLCFTLLVPVYGTESSASTVSTDYSRLQDQANLLSDSEYRELSAKLDEISARQQLDVVIITTQDLGGYAYPSDYAEYLFTSCGFGFGSSKDGILLLVSMAERDWHIATHGYAITAFTDAGLAYIEDEFLSYLSDGEYEKAFDTFASLCDDFLTQAKYQTPYDYDNLPKEPLSLSWIPLSYGIGLVIALLIVAGMKGQLKTVRSAATANNYICRDRLNITDVRDVFLYRNVTRVPIPKDDNSSRGGSSTHHSSSGGGSFGGRGGKF